jgi:hypothetical protein
MAFGIPAVLGARRQDLGREGAIRVYVMTHDRERLVVRSHVARDLLQTAGLFKSDHLVVWEYVVNGLQYVEARTHPQVRVTLDPKRKRITISDNGRGMDWEGLHNFFVMHGENLDRKQGRAGRGRFGTGKAAAFGIAGLLRITTVQNGRRSKVELRRAEIQAMRSGEAIPVTVLEREVSTSEANGTRVEIEEIQLRSLDQAGIIRFIERHLARWPKNASVTLNNHVCEVSEPPVESVARFPAEGSTRELLGDVELLVKVSKLPLGEEDRGIAIFSKGIWHALTLAGSEGKEMSQYLFGEIDVPKLEDDLSAVAPFTVSRSMELNPNNELVQELHAFIHNKVEEVRRALAEADKRRRATEEARRLAAQAAEIARVINADFEAFRGKVKKVRAKASGGTDLFGLQPSTETDNGTLTLGGDTPAEPVHSVSAEGGTGAGGKSDAEPPDRPPLLEAQEDGQEKGQPAPSATRKTRPCGGFNVQFDYLGAESQRAKYMPDERTIYVNLDHPQLAAARGSRPVEDPNFRRLAYEVALTEYAIALATELAQLDGYFYEFTDPIVEIGDTLNRLARKGAHLYATRS